MILFHGSTVDIDSIDLSLSQPNKDFGKGFYLSDNEQQARDMASFKARLFGKEPIINVYEIDDDALTSGALDVKRFDGYTVEWAEFVLANRTASNGDSAHNHDVVYGPIANDRVGLQIRRLTEQEIDLDTFVSRLKYMKGITFRYFFGTERSIGYLHKKWTESDIK